MSNDIKSGLGYLIPAGALVGFILSLLAESYLLSVVFAAGGILVWLLYMKVMETVPPGVMGNIIVLFGVLLAVGVFMIYGLEQNLHGGIEFRPEGTIFALIILFFSVLSGLLYNRGREVAPKEVQPKLTDQEKGWVREAVEKTEGETTEPKVIVIKPEVQEEETEEETEEEYDYEEYDPYRFAYPPDYYGEFDEDEEEEYEDDEEEEE